MSAMPDIDYGGRLRAGVLVPSGNSVAEPSGLPVLTSNQSMAWHLLRSSGIDDRIDGYGRLFSI